MNTVRTARHWIFAGRQPVNMDNRDGLIAVLLCVAVFGCFFAIGRMASPEAASRDDALQGLPVSPADNAIPDRLSSAPAIEERALEPTNAHPRSQSQAPLAASAVPAPEPPTTTPNGAQESGTNTSSSHTPAPTSTPAPAPSPRSSAPTSPTQTQGSSGSKPGSQKSGGTSFDSSG